ncbi:MAG TPA: hypothetical protein VMN39_07325 [Longimicrobiaceae bacterium]|nr:hypothetical protein [Longimicrobiaceae bacterium]
MNTAASQSLLALRDELARDVTETLYAEMPDLHERYGERGREKCLQDIRYNVEHLAPAVALGDPGIFARYAEWLQDLLDARGVRMDEVHRSLELIRDLLRRRLPPDEAEPAVRAIDAGLATIAPNGRPG